LGGINVDGGQRGININGWRGIKLIIKMVLVVVGITLVKFSLVVIAIVLEITTSHDICSKNTSVGISVGSCCGIGKDGAIVDAGGTV